MTMSLSLTQRQRLASLLRELLNHEEVPEVNCYVEVFGKRGLEVRRRVRSWVKNFNALIYGLLDDSNQAVVNVEGAENHLRTSGEMNYEAVVIRLGIDDTPPSYNDYGLKSFITTLTTSRELVAITNGYRIRVYGDYTPDKDIIIYELSLEQTVYEDGGSSIKVMWLREVFPDGVSHAAGETKTYSVTLDITV